MTAIDERALGAAIIEGSNMAGERLVTQIVTAYLKALGDEGWVLVPKEPSEEQIEAMADAYRTTRRPSVCGMTIDAQFRAEFAPWFAVYRAMLSAAGGRDE